MLDSREAAVVARGSILKRKNKNGTVTYSIKYRAQDGTQVKRAVGPVRAEAEKALTTALAEVDRGQLRSASKETSAAAAARWLDRKKSRLEASTLQDYERHLRLRLLPAFGPMPLRRISRRHVEDYIHSLDVGGALSRKTINDSLIPLRQVLGMALREGTISTNPAVSADRDAPIELPYERPTMAFLRREEAIRYLEAAQADYRLLAEVLLGAGLRIGEALALQWGDVRREAGVLSVSRTFKVGGIGTPKGDRVRAVVIADYLFEMLEDSRPSDADGLDLIFTRQGDPIRRQWVHRFWHRTTLAEAGLPLEVRLHDLRHTAATLWLASGQSIYFVQQQLGHKDIQTTIDLYGHPDRQAHRQAAQQAARWWREGVSEGVSVPPVVPQTAQCVHDEGDQARPSAVFGH